MLIRPLYLNVDLVDLKKCAIRHMLLTQDHDHNKPNDYHMFLNLNKHLSGQRFMTDDELMCAAKER